MYFQRKEVYFLRRRAQRPARASSESALDGGFGNLWYDEMANIGTQVCYARYCSFVNVIDATSSLENVTEE